MTSTAISSQGSTFQVATGAGAAKAITGVAEGNPSILTCVGHGLANGDVESISGATAPAGLNGTFVVSHVTPNTYAIDLDTTGGAALAGAPIATPVAWTQVGNFKTIKGFDGKVPKLDSTNLSSQAKEFKAGLYDPGQFSFDVDIDMTDPGQLAIRANLAAATTGQYKLTLPNGKTATFNAIVESFPMDGGVDKLLSSTVTLNITGPVTYA